MYQFKNDINNDLFFRFNKRWVTDMNWAILPLSAKAVLPVIGCHLNENGNAWPAENTIAVLAGLTPKTTRKAITALLDFPGFSYRRYKTRTLRLSKKFKLIIPKNDSQSFFFYKTVIIGGNWKLSKPVSKAVYVVMRTFATWDVDEIPVSTDEEIRAYYADRDYDLCETPPGEIGEYAGISRARVFDAFYDLQKRHLIEPDGDLWKVYLRPPFYFKRDHLNGITMKEFSCEVNK